ncbi:TonB family protein [uncultured Desulfovibrio sp.]|uniref:TonB family protein n=11 Tax=uncultured Desulfovibrio sp. TaxID=167968 RepID=UPI0025CBB078|nr:TonB family protein [uncultured Desulfovibrio sp.]
MPAGFRASHPSQEQSRSRCRALGTAALCLCAALVAVPAGRARAASMAAASQNEGYSGHVMEKVLTVWTPPTTRDERQVRLRISLDGEGRVSECKAVRPSGLPALDSSACAAVREAAPFGTPPYGMPLEVYFSFWTGQPRGKSAARQTAQVPATPAAAAPAAAQAPAPDAQTRAAALAAETATGGAARAPEPAPRAAASGAGFKAQDKYDARFQKYIGKVVWKLRNAMYIPAKTRPGTYHATAQVRYDAAGKILDATLLKGSGDALLDKYVLQGIRRAGSVPPPPAGLGDTLDLTFTLTRQ